MNKVSPLIIFFLCFVLSIYSQSQRTEVGVNPKNQESNIFVQFQNLPYQPDVMLFEHDKKDDPKKYTIGDNSCGAFRKNHFQGIQRVSDDVFVLSAGRCKARGHGQSQAELLILQCSKHRIAHPEDSLMLSQVTSGPLFRHRGHAQKKNITLDSVKTIKINEDYCISPKYWHAGGIGACGNILSVPLESSVESSIIVFFDISDPINPVLIDSATICRPIEKSGTTALFFDVTIQRYICVVWTDSDCFPRRFDFYISNSKDLKDGFKREKEIHCGASDKVAYQQIQLLRDELHGLVLLCSENSGGLQPISSGNNVVDLFKVDHKINIAKSLIEIDTVHLIWKKDFLKTQYYDFDASASFYISPAGQLIMYSLHHFYYRWNKIVISEFVSNDPHEEIDSAAGSYVELYSEKEFEGQKLTFRGQLDSITEFAEKTFMAQLKYFPTHVQSIKYKLPRGSMLAFTGSNRWKDNEAIFEGKGHEVACPDLKLCRMDIIELSKMEYRMNVKPAERSVNRREYVEEMMVESIRNSLEQNPHLVAGFGRSMLTPPPGSYMAGYSVAGKQAAGWWTNLYASSIFLEGTNGMELILVNTDLWGISAGMHKKVIELVNNRKEPGLNIGVDNLVISATHNHNGPGNYMSSFLYNRNTSCKSGYDPHMFHFLTDSIAQSIIRAYKDRHRSDIHITKTKAPGLSRNRSIEAFRLNPLEQIGSVVSEQVGSYLQMKGDNGIRKGHIEDQLLAVDNTISILRLQNNEDASQMTYAIFFAAHPTVLGSSSQMINSDVIGIARELVESYFAAKKLDVKTLFFNGAQGDVSFNWNDQHRREVIRIAKKMAHHILSGILEGAYQEVGTDILNRYTDQTLPHQLIIDHNNEVPDTYNGKYIVPRTSPKPKFGMPTIGGAEDARTALYNVLPNTFREGNRKKSGELPNGTKKLWPLLKPFVAANFIKDCFPFEVPISVHFIGDLPLVALAGEFTVMSGHRIKSIITELSPPNTDLRYHQPLMIGLANEYISYVTTPQEYALQHYEGSSTIYGPMSLLLVENTIRRMLDSLTYNAPSDTLKYTYYPFLKKDSLVNNYLSNIQIEATDTRDLLEPFVTRSDRTCTAIWTTDSTDLPIVSLGNRDAHGLWKVLEIDYNVSDDYKVRQTQSQNLSSNFITFPIASHNDNNLTWRTVWIHPEGMSGAASMEHLEFKIEDGHGKTEYKPCIQVKARSWMR